MIAEAYFLVRPRNSSLSLIFSVFQCFSVSAFDQSLVTSSPTIPDLSVSDFQYFTLSQPVSFLFSAFQRFSISVSPPPPPFPPPPLPRCMHASSPRAPGRSRGRIVSASRRPPIARLTP